MESSIEVQDGNLRQFATITCKTCRTMKRVGLTKGRAMKQSQTRDKKWGAGKD